MTTSPLPQAAAERKAVPVVSGLLDYFPAALVAVAECSKAGNDQHNPGKPLHWDRAKSGDEADALLRHLIDRGTVDTDGIRHSAKVAWRALALLQKELEAAGAPVARGARNAPVESVVRQIFAIAPDGTCDDPDCSTCRSIKAVREHRRNQVRQDTGD